MANKISSQSIIAVIGIGFASSTIGAGFEERGYKATLEKFNNRLTATVGKSYWVYFDRPDCKYLAPRLTQQPSIRSTSFYTAAETTKLKVEAIIDQPTEIGKYFKISINDTVTAYEYSSTSSLPDIPNEITDSALKTNCILPIPPEEVRARIELLETKAAETERQQKAALAAQIAAEAAIKNRPGVKIGMSKRQVIEKTSWGEPDHINRTTTAHGEREQWVYSGGSYLYFTNGKLTAVQN